MFDMYKYLGTQKTKYKYLKMQNTPNINEVQPKNNPVPIHPIRDKNGDAIINIKPKIKYIVIRCFIEILSSRYDLFIGMF